MFDLIVRGAEVVDERGRKMLDVAVTDGKVAALLPPGAAADSRTIVDASGLLVLPGLVDAHVHLREPGLVHKEGFESGTRAAAAGGVTTVMVMPTDKPVTLTPEQFAEKRSLADGKAYVDYALQAGAGVDMQHIKALTDLGAISFEIFMADVASEFLVRDAESLMAVLRAIAATGRVAGLTPGDHDVVIARTAAAKTMPPSWQAIASARPTISEALGVARGCLAARESGAAVHVRQISCATAVDVLQAFKSSADISAEVMPHNLLLDDTEPDRQGAVAKVAPPLRPASDLLAVRQALRDGLIDMAATDHAPHAPEEKGVADIWAAPGGFPGLQTFLPAMLELVGRGEMSMMDLVRTCAAAPARRFGLYPRKGALQAGSDADMVLVDPRRRHVVRNEDQYSKAKLTPFAGRECQGAPVKVFLRGEEIMADGKVEGARSGVFLRP